MKLILLEIWSYLQLFIGWWAFKKWAKRDIKGDILAGAIVGIMIEFTSEPLWDYHFKITIYKDIPLSIPFAWGLMFAMVVFLSEKLYCWILRKQTVELYDKRILIFDVIGAVLIGFPMETIGIKTGIWDYRYDLLKWDWGTVPFTKMPYEALFGYCVLMLTAPTFVRYWQGAFEERFQKK